MPDMKTRYHHNPLRAAACLVAALCLLCTAACTDDDRLPATDPAPGTVPLILTAGVAAPATTRAATAAGQWTDGDVVAVEMDGVVKKYIAHAPAGAVATLRPADEDNTHYWPAKTASVRAWYYGGVTPAPWNRVPNRWNVAATQYLTLDGESFYQRSDFLYAPLQTVTYAPGQQGAAAGLTFYHQTARVVVRIRRAGVVNDVNKGDITVMLGYGPSSAHEMWGHGTFDASPIDPAAGQYSGLTARTEVSLSFIAPREIPGAPADGYARCYEALVIPQDMSGKHFIHVDITHADGRGEYYYVPAAGEADLRGGYTYTYDVTVSKHGTLRVTAATPIPGWTDGGTGGSGTLEEEPTLIDLANPPTISDNGTYLLTGTANDVTLPITGGNPTVIVRDIDLQYSCIHITGGTPEIRVEGINNNLYGGDNPPIWLDGDNANVRITGNGTAASWLSLRVGDYYPNAAIGSKGMYVSREDHGCGNITISNLRIDANSQVQSMELGGAAIGTGGGDGSRKCGDITITDAHIAAFPGQGAASIGFGYPPGNNMTGTTYEMGTITITGSVIESNISRGRNSVWPAHIGGGAAEAEMYLVGGMIINTDKSGPDFFANFNGGTKVGDEVIVGFPGEKRGWPVRWNVTGNIAAIKWSILPLLP